MKKSKAFTMIELIFAIVIMGIIVSSIPSIVNTNEKSFEDSLIQDAIFANSAKLQYSLYTSYWDLNSTSDYDNSFCNTESQPGLIVNTEDLNCSDKLGLFDSQGHRHCQKQGMVQDKADDSTEQCRYNINNLSGTSTLIDSVGLYSYKGIYDVNISVSRDKEIKKITGTVLQDSKTKVKLNVYRANIGGVRSIDLPSKEL